MDESERASRERAEALAADPDSRAWITRKREPMKPPDAATIAAMAASTSERSFTPDPRLALPIRPSKSRGVVS